MSSAIEIPKVGSPETQAIVDACFQLESKGAQVQQTLETLVPARDQQALEALNSFMGQARQQGEEFLKAHEQSLKMVETAFGHFREGLQEILKASRENSAENTIKAAFALAAASFGIRGAVVAYEESYLSFGDSRFPLINLLTNLGERVRGGQVPPESWANTCQRYAYFYGGAVDEIDKSKDKDKPGVSERRAALVKLVEQLQGLEKLGASDSRNTYDDFIFVISGCLVDLSEAFETYHSHVFLTGESASPRINLLIKVAQGTAAGTYDKGVLNHLVRDLSEELQGRLKELDRLAQEPQDSEVLNDCIAEMIDTLETLSDGLAILARLAKGEKLPDEEIQEALDLLLESGDMLADVNKAVAAHNQSTSRVTCVTCGAEQAAAERCLSCNSQLPLPVASGVESSFEMVEGKDDVEAGEAVVTTVMQELSDRTGDFDAARIDGDAYYDILDLFDNKIDAAEESLSQMQAPDMPEGLSPEDREICNEFISIADDGLSLLELGLAECREGIEHLRHFAETREKEARLSGLQLYFEGTQKMWLVRRAQKRVEQFIIDSAAMLPPDINRPTQGPQPGAPGSLSSRFT